uniref:Methylcrotonoyl-CoA carboxylase subunit alpha n=1 Tax=Arundo donax TaxID=35708 RepID=A0A0A9G0N0_ARUDO
MILLDALLSPISRIADAGGPMNLSPSASQSCAKSALSERKPYPGCIAWAPVRSAASTMAAALR